MTTSLQTTAAQPEEFLAPPGAGLRAALFIAGGCLFLLLLLFQFLLLLSAKPSPSNQMMPGLLGGASVVGIGLIARGTFLLRSLRRVTASPDALTLEGFASRTTVPFSQIARLDRAKRSPLLGGTSVEVLTLLDSHDRPLAAIPATVQPFDALCDLVAARAASARGDGRPTFDPADNAARQQAKAARKIKWAALIAFLLTAGMAAGLVAGVNEELHERRFATADRQLTPARITRRYMVRVTPRLEYAFSDPAGLPHTREVMLAQDAYDDLEGAQTVDVEYLRSDPEWNRPVRGLSPDEAHFGGKLLLVTGGGTLLFGLLFLFTALGFDLQSDQGRTTLLRHGRILRQWGPNPTPATPNSPPPAPFSSTTSPPPPPPMGWPSPTSSPSPGTPGEGRGEGSAPRPPHISDAPSSARGMGDPPMSSLPPSSIPHSPSSPPSRPTGLLALGILSLLFGLAGTLLALVRYLLSRQGVLHLPDGRLLITATSPALTLWNAADGLLALLLLATGILLLRLRRPARPLGLAAAAGQLLSSAGALALVLSDLAHSDAGTGPDASRFITMAAGAILGKLLGAIFPLILLLILARRRTAAALR